MYEYRKSGRYFAQCADDIQEIVAEELEELGANAIKPGYRGVYFTADRETLYAVNYRSRLATRILAPVITFDCHSDDYLYTTALSVNWNDFITEKSTFAVFAAVSHSRIRHSKYAALRLKDAIVDYFRKSTGRRPDIDTKNPDIWFNLHIENNRARISVDTSGGSLHRRGYRTASVEAPMAETVAASVIRYSGWNGETPLYDPMCGSGTILCEAYLSATGTPPAILRKAFGFMRLPDYDASVWERVRTGVSIRSVPKGMIAGSDADHAAAAAARQNCSLIDRNHAIDIQRRDLFDIPTLHGYTIVTNPPYGIRLRDKGSIEAFYKRFGDFLKQRCTGSVAYIYFGNRSHLKNIGLRPAFRKALKNGGLDGRLARFDLY
ncbi:MAG: THUMP domain-containing class I SAM-dependent RNA methyltransferase [Spirochaetota bacterium]